MGAVRQPWVQLIAVCWMGGAVRELVHRFKYSGRRDLAALLASWMELGAARLDFRPDALVPVPMHWWRRWRRGYNQAEILADELGARLGIQVWRCLRRVRGTGSQTMLGRSQRMGNLQGAICVAHSPPLSGRHLLLVDDVLTTGATVDACARKLLEAGAASVRVLALARG